MSSSYGRYNSQSYAPSAPELPPPSNHTPPNHNYTQTSPPSSNYNNNYPHGYSYGGQVSSSGYPPPSSYVSSSSGYSDFPPGTNPDVIRSFQMVDRDRSGFIDDRELQQALSSSFHNFNLRTIRLLIFLFKHPQESLRIGPKEFTELWSCLGHWRIAEAEFLQPSWPICERWWVLAFSQDPSSTIDNIDGIFERYDKDRSGKIDPLELRDALYGIGYAVPASVLQLLLSKYSDGSSRRVELGFDSFVECGMIIKGLTDKFKVKDKRYSGSATLSYDEFMSMVLPFLVSYD